MIKIHQATNEKHAEIISRVLEMEDRLWLPHIDWIHVLPITWARRVWPDMR